MSANPPPVLSTCEVLTVTYPSIKNGLSWSLPVEPDIQTANKLDAVELPSASANANLVVDAYEPPPWVVLR